VKAALPLSGATAGNIAVIGPNAQLSQSDAGYYGPHNVCGGNFWTVVDAMKKYHFRVICMAIGTLD
jgi:hypothetical protein